MPAKSWDSYKETLYALLEAYEPRRVFEWGPGHSTDIIANFRSVEKMYSVEHDHGFYEKMRTRLYAGLFLVLKPDLEEYAAFNGDGGRYDLIFIDGAARPECLRAARGMLATKAPDERPPDGLVLLHDAARLEYKEAIAEYPVKIFTDDGNTVILSMNPNDERNLQWTFRKISISQSRSKDSKITT